MTEPGVTHPIRALPKADLGEGPLWDHETQSLYWVDITGHWIYRLDPASGRCTGHDVGTFVSFVVLDTRGSLVAGLRDGIYRFDFGAVDRTVLFRPAMHPGNRFNDGKCDPGGRLWAGTMHIDAHRDREPTGALYRFDQNGCTAIETSLGISNGLGWGPDGSKMYFAETFKGIVWVYDFDVETGHAGNRRVFATIPRDEGVPDGLTVDCEGRVLVAIWRGARINIYTPSGDLDAVVRLPVSCPTSCCFGGADLKTLFITTHRRNDPSSAESESGFLFSCRLDRPGMASPRMRFDL